MISSRSKMIDLFLSFLQEKMFNSSYDRSLHEPKAMRGGRPSFPSQHGLHDFKSLLSRRAAAGRAAKSIILVSFLGQIFAT